MNSAIDIALIHSGDARNVRTASGSLFFSKHAFARHIGSISDLTPASVNLFPYRAAGRIIRYTTGRQYSFDKDISLAKRLGAYFSKRLRDSRHDLIFSPFDSSSIAYLETDTPIVVFTDITWPLARDYYACYTNLVDRCVRAGTEIERRTFERSSVILLSSHWAAESVIRDYGIDPAKVHVPYIGANLIHPPARQDVLPKRLGKTIRLLLVGVNWEIKGGSIAMDALTELLAMGYDAELTVVGCSAPNGVSHPRMQVIPFLNKQIPEERARFEQLWRDADFFIFPTRFEAAGLVLCEASAYAIPSIAADTGGVSSLVRNGRNGYTVPHEAGGSRYAEIIASLADNPEQYAALCQTSREEFETRLNWDSWGAGVARAVARQLPHLAARLPQYEESYNLPLSHRSD